MPDPPATAKDKGRIYFYCPAKLWGAALFASIRLNGQAIGKPITGRFFFKDVDPGTREVAIRTEVLSKRSVTISAEQTVYVRVSAALGWVTTRYRLEFVAPETAETEMQDLVPVSN